MIQFLTHGRCVIRQVRRCVTEGEAKEGYMLLPTRRLERFLRLAESPHRSRLRM